MVSTPRRRPPRNDVALVRAILQGSREHFDLLYEAYFPRVHGFALRRLESRADAEDVTQEVFAAVFEALPSWRGDSSLLVWIFGMTRNVIGRRFRVARPREAPLDEGTAARLPGRSPVIERVVEARRRVARCHAAMASRLTPLELRIFQLKYLRHSSIAEIAEAVDVTPYAVKSHLHRIRRSLAQQVET